MFRTFAPTKASSSSEWVGLAFHALMLSERDHRGKTTLVTTSSLLPFSGVSHKAFLSTICQLFDWPNYTNIRLGFRPLLLSTVVR